MESTTINNAIKKVREFFNEIRGSLSRIVCDQFKILK